MTNIKYSDEEIKTFKKALSIIIDELESLWKLSGLEEINIPVILNGIEQNYKDRPKDNWKFIINEKHFILKSEDRTREYSFTIARRNNLGKLKKILKIYPIDIIFINEYPSIKEQIKRKIEHSIEKKEQSLTIAKNIINEEKREKEALIEINMPPSNNRHEIKIREENGKTIGTIDFGSRIIKIITDGSIVLVPEEYKIEKSEKTKRI